MIKSSRRFHQSARKRELYEQLRARQAALGLKNFKRPTLPNSKSQYITAEEEAQDRQLVVEEQLKAFRVMLPTLLKRLSKIKDPRNPQTTKHKLTVVLLYGILCFVFQMSSRREANREMTRPMFLENLKELFPELKSCPHADTLNRLLVGLEEDVEQILDAHVELIRKFMSNKTFRRYLIEHCYTVAIDGTQKFSRDYRWSEGCLKRRVNGAEEENDQYYVYVLEADLVFANGLVIPCLSEVLEYPDYASSLESKQDCELKAFYRLAARLKKYFPRLPIMVLLDGLYANGPVFALCKRFNWQFMIVLQDGSLPSVWEEAAGLGKLQPENTLERTWGNRRQRFWWVNDIYYYYGQSGRKKQVLHLVVCEERWEEVDLASLKIVEKKSRHAWVSSHPLSSQNVHRRCNLLARHRWSIENNILVEKRYGYRYEHCFSYDWNAMKGFHYLMRIAHMMNTLAQRTFYLAQKVRTIGSRGLIDFFFETLSNSYLDTRRLRDLIFANYQFRLE
jgi:hypothetical protein